MPDQTTVRRREDGSIDIEFYRQQGLAERRAIVNRALRRMGKGGKSFAALAMVAMVLTAVFTGAGSAGPTPM